MNNWMSETLVGERERERNWRKRGKEKEQNRKEREQQMRERENGHFFKKVWLCQKLPVFAKILRVVCGKKDQYFLENPRAHPLIHSRAPNISRMTSSPKSMSKIFGSLRNTEKKRVRNPKVIFERTFEENCGHFLLSDRTIRKMMEREERSLFSSHSRKREKMREMNPLPPPSFPSLFSSSIPSPSPCLAGSPSPCESPPWWKNSWKIKWKKKEKKIWSRHGLTSSESKIVRMTFSLEEMLCRELVRTFSISWRDDRETGGRVGATISSFSSKSEDEEIC